MITEWKRTLESYGPGLPLEVRDLFREWLMSNFPDRYRHVFKLIRDMRGGKDLAEVHDGIIADGGATRRL